MTDTVRIQSRFRGPPQSGNGGYVAGLLARHGGRPSGAEVTLLKPPPLDRDLAVVRDGGGAVLRDGETTIATMAPAAVEIKAPPPVSPEEAAAAVEGFTGFSHHIFPECFVCGPARGEGDGLRIFPGAAGARRVAAPWRPSPDLCGADGKVAPEFVWAALDCPGYFAVQEAAGAAVLGRLAVRIDREVGCDEPLVAVGWPIESAGRKHRAGTALYSGDALKAVGVATWISLAAS